MTKTLKTLLVLLTILALAAVIACGDDEPPVGPNDDDDASSSTTSSSSTSTSSSSSSASSGGGVIIPTGMTLVRDETFNGGFDTLWDNQILGSRTSNFTATHFQIQGTDAGVAGFIGNAQLGPDDGDAVVIFEMDNMDGGTLTAGEHQVRLFIYETTNAANNNFMCRIYESAAGSSATSYAATGDGTYTDGGSVVNNGITHDDLAIKAERNGTTGLISFYGWSSGAWQPIFVNQPFTTSQCHFQIFVADDAWTGSGTKVVDFDAVRVWN